MPFTENQKAHFLTLLQTKGWQLRDGIIWSPRGGLHFSNSHFSDWSPENMHEIFSRRATRLGKYKTGPLAHAEGENLQASWAAEEAMKLS